MASTTTAKKEIVDFLWDWADSHGDWGKLLVNKVVSGESRLSQKDRQEIFNYFLQSITLHSGLPALQITKPTYTPTDKKIELTSLSDIKGVNKLAKDQTIIFSKNLTVIYGENGSGKTGYSRILKSLGFSYDGVSTIHCNIFKDPEAQSAVINFKLNEAEVSFDWTGDNRHAELNNISVFNTNCVQISLGDRQLIVSPIGFHLFQLVTEELNQLSLLLQVKLSSHPTNLVWSDALTAGTPQSNFVSELSGSSTIEQLNELATFTPDHEKELNAKEQELADLNKTLIVTEIGNLTSQIADLRRLILKLQVTEAGLSPDNRKILRSYNKVIKELEGKTQVSLKEIAEANAIELYQSDEFKRFISSADTYIKILSKEDYPQKDDLCIYCKQPLDTAAQELLTSYRELLNDKTQENLEQAQKKKGDLITGVSKLDVQLLFHQPVFGYDEKQQIIQPQELTNYNQKAEQYKADFLSDEETDGDADSFDFKEISSFLTDKKNNLERRLISKREVFENIGQKETQLKKEIAELKDRKLLSGKIVEISAAISNHQITAVLNKNYNSFNTNSISRKTSEAREELLKQNFNDIFQNELKALRKSHIKINLSFATAKGSSQVYQNLNSYKLAEVLSEGEQKAIALAEFLSELQLDMVKAPVIFDDPVNSLDHRIIDEVAKRLIELSKQRQVVVFTHSVLLLNSFIQQKELEINKPPAMDFVFYRVKTNFGETGILDEVEEINSYSYYSKKLDLVLQTKPNGKSEEELAAKGYGHLRSAIEVTVEESVLKNVIKRYRKGVAFPSFIRIDGGKLDACKKELNDIYEKCCVSIDGHSSPEENHTTPTLDELKNDYEEFKKVRKQFTS